MERSNSSANNNNGYGSSMDLRHTGYTYSNSGEAWVEVGRNRTFVPGPDDVGCILKFECTAHDVASAYQDVGKTFSIVTARVRPAPNPPRRSLVPITPPHASVTKGAFTVLSYNLLADLYATAEMFGYCPSWALAWPYRRLNLLKELLGYNADVLCLQEVQSNHFTEFLAPEMAKAGYTAIYKKKTTEMYTRNAYAIDGCATFFRKDKFSLVKKYEVEFNKAALSLAEALPPEQKKAALHRLLKDNVALIAVLEALEPPFADGGSSATTTASGDSPTASSAPSAAPAGGAPRRQLVCVANTHIHSNPELNDVKLWQVHTLLKGLEKIAASADIPMLVAGDFNATPVSAAHSLLVEGSVPPVSPELLNDPLGILKPVNKLSHRLPLASAYQTVAASPDDDHSAQRQKRRLDPATGEPRFTNITRDFKGTLDYILYSKDSLVPSAALELPDETEVRSKSQPGLPNDQWSSDHVALMVEFQYRAPAGGGASAGGSGEEVELNQPASPPTAH
jgi:CCR4-NOT transcription complex subunit 6